VLEQLQQAGLLSRVTDVRLDPFSVRFVASLPLLAMLDADARFAKGILYGLHRDVGHHLIDYRSHTGVLGKGSLQVVVDTSTYESYADVDSFSPYTDLVGIVGHTGEVIKGWFRKGERA
jgi:hypothetical protein